MFPLAILFFVIAIMAISFSIPEVVLSPASISGTLSAAILIYLTAATIVSRFRKQPVEGETL